MCQRTMCQRTIDIFDFYDILYTNGGEWDRFMKFSELVRLLEQNGFKIIKEKGSVRYYRKPGWNHLIRIDYHGPKEVPTGTCYSILKNTGIKK